MRIGRTPVMVGSLIALAVSAHGQSVDMAGSVVDRWETAVPDARLTLTSPLTGASLMSTSNPAGEYVFPQMTPGRYDLAVRAGGFKLYTRHGIEIVGAAARMEVRMDREKDNSGATIRELETVAAAQPDDYLAHFVLGRAYFAKGDLDKALKQFQESLKLRPGDAPARLGVAQVALRGGGPATTLRIAQELIRSEPGNGLATMLAAAVYRLTGQPDAAADLLARFLVNNPNDTEVLIELGSTDAQRKQYPEAAKAFVRAYDMDPSNIQALRGQIEIQLALKEPEKALQLIAGEVEKYPQRGDLRKELAATEVRTRQFDKAMADYQSILEKYQETPQEQADTYARIAGVYQIKEDLPHSIENLKKATQLAPGNAAYVTSLAVTYDLSGKPQEALVCYKHALKIDPGNALLMNNAAYSIARAGGDLDEALRLVQLARRQMPN